MNHENDTLYQSADVAAEPDATVGVENTQEESEVEHADEQSATMQTLEERAAARGLLEHYRLALKNAEDPTFHNHIRSVAVQQLPRASYSDADDVVQDVLLNMLRFPRSVDLKTGKIPMQFSVGQRIIDIYRARTGAVKGTSTMRQFPISNVFDEVEERAPHHDERLHMAVSEAMTAGPDIAERIAVQETLRPALALLSEAHRDVLVRRFFYEQDNTEIAADMGISVGTVKSRYFYALRQLRAQLEANPDVEEQAA